ncbi:uncharacterized protein LODBEIA_P41280 [Lodderomyces beijingensis]|uniref:Uncharacterized protein n=1 Tax=Lodderomyces beijingensis TaxID=1775926 RepID=A0ABP0ZPR5_9ASCO
MTKNEITSLNEKRLETLHHYGPVTALRIFGENHILVGYGPILHIYKLEQNLHHDQKMELIFSRQVFKRSKIHSISVNLHTKLVVLSGAKSFASFNFDDLPHAQFKERGIHEWIITSSSLDDGTIILLNAYNMVYQIGTDGKTLENKIHCGEKSILYSGSINHTASGKVVVAAGTVMNGVILWDLNSREILHRLVDHEGSIFGVKMDPSGRYIISCSDDRSIKLYEFESGHLIASGWGHGSRIWGLEFYRVSDDDHLEIMSIGEDCTMRMWRFHSGDESLTEIKCIENCHKGKHVWSGDVLAQLGVCVTGGADGRVRLHDLKSENHETRQITLSEMSTSVNIQFKKSDFIRDYFELSKKSSKFLVCLTSNGHVVVYDYKTSAFEHLGFYQALNGFGIVHGFEDISTVVVSSRTGDLLCITFNHDGVPLHHKWIANSQEMKITNMLTSSPCAGKYFVLLESPNPQIPFICKEFSSFGEGDFNLVQILHVPKPTMGNFSVTAMTIDARGWLILASKKMSLVVVDIHNLSRCLSLRKIAPGDTVSSVSVIDTGDNFMDALILARDGTYLIARFSAEHTGFAFTIPQENKLTRGFIEGGYLDQQKQLILYGFKSSYFYLWNETKQVEIFSEHCGGNGHRHFHFQRTTREERFSFVYSFKSDVYICSHLSRFGNVNHGLIHGGVQGREIRDLSIQRRVLDDNSRLLVSSAEDSTILLSKLYPNGEVDGIWSMNNHISGMQKVEFLNNDYILSSAANEEFFIWQLSWFQNVPTIREIARLKSDQEVPDLRVMDFDAVEHPDSIFIVTVFSDSQIKLWNFDKSKKTFQLINQWCYSTCCILNCQILEIGDGEELKRCLMIGTTDGFVTTWNITDPTHAELQSTEQLHHSGVKATCLIPGDNTTYLVTGGDDNVLALSKINEDLTITPLTHEINAASATITSIAPVSRKRSEFVVVSVDQIVRVWSLQDEKLVCHTAKYTTVADTGCCDVVDDLLVVGGSGLTVERIGV